MNKDDRNRFCSIYWDMNAILIDKDTEVLERELMALETTYVEWFIEEVRPQMLQLIWSRITAIKTELAVRKKVL